MPRATQGTDVYAYKIIDHMTPFFCRNNIHPNVVTIIGGILSFLVLSPRLTPLQKVAVVALVRFLDHLDGEVARKCKKTSKIGAYLDSAMDVVALTTILMVAFKIKPTLRNISLMCMAIWAIAARFVDPLTHDSPYRIVQMSQNNCILCGVVVATGAFYLGKK
jgi:phosphatidylglycerophosphate synthase